MVMLKVVLAMVTVVQHQQVSHEIYDVLYSCVCARVCSYAYYVYMCWTRMGSRWHWWAWCMYSNAILKCKNWVLQNDGRSLREHRDLAGTCSRTKMFGIDFYIKLKVVHQHSSLSYHPFICSDYVCRTFSVCKFYSWCNNQQEHKVWKYIFMMLICV